jgi:hypothetical protein
MDYSPIIMARHYWAPVQAMSFFHGSSCSHVSYLTHSKAGRSQGVVLFSVSSHFGFWTRSRFDEQTCSVACPTVEVWW